LVILIDKLAVHSSSPNKY